MVLNFKIDKNDKLWLLWCSSLRIEGKKILQGQDKSYKFVSKNQKLNALPLQIEHKPQVILILNQYL